jgi:hypothetical protein
MEISAKHAKMIFATDFGDEEINLAVNFMQEAYDRFMKPAWDKLQTAVTDEEKAEAGADAAKRGLGFVVATGAFHMHLSKQAPPEIVEMVANIIADCVTQMGEQVEAQKAADKLPAAKA